MINRTITKQARELLQKKILLISGPRQVGKTFLSRVLAGDDHQYLSFDDEDDRRIIMDRSWSREVEVVIFDELHKMENWKTWLKAIYDKEGISPKIIVTGSARMDTFKKGGDSLAGRHFHVRLNPLSLKEVNQGASLSVAESMMSVGTFPEPFLENNLKMSKLWRKSHLERIIKEDLLDLEKVTQLKKIEILVQLLSERVGSMVSYSSLARDLEVSSHTVKHWLQILEDLYVIFRVTPYSKDISKSITKTPKFYFYDLGRVKSEKGGLLENFVALHFLKRNQYLEDLEGDSLGLYYVRDKLKREVDFLITKDYQVEYLIEVKLKDNKVSKNLRYFHDLLKPANSIQLVYELKQEQQFDEIKVKDLTKFLFGLET